MFAEEAGGEQEREPQAGVHVAGPVDGTDRAAEVPPRCLGHWVVVCGPSWRPSHSHPSSPPCCRRVCRVPSVLILARVPHAASTNIARAAPNPDHTLSSRLCLCACTCHGSLQGTAGRVFSPQSGSLLPLCPGAPPPCWSCDLDGACWMCFASAAGQSPVWPEAEAVVASLPLHCHLPGRRPSAVFPLLCSFLLSKTYKGSRLQDAEISVQGRICDSANCVQ